MHTEGRQQGAASLRWCGVDLTVLIDGEERTAEHLGGRVVIAADRLAEVLGWTLKPEGLCRDERCVPVADPERLDAGDGLVDVVEAAAVLGRSTLVAADDGVAVVSAPLDDRRQALAGRRAAPFTLPDLDGQQRSLTEWAGKKKLLTVWASW